MNVVNVWFRVRCCFGGEAAVSSSQASSWCNELLLECLLTRLQLSASHPLATQANGRAMWDEASRDG